MHKYLTDPMKRDSDGDGTPDGDWDERREYAYSIRTVLRYLPPCDEKGLNDDFQDARVLSRSGEYIEVEVIHYPLATAQEAISENRNWRRDYAQMTEYLAPGVTTNWDEQMQRDLLAALKTDGIDVESLTDKQVVEQVSRWLMARSRSLDKVFSTFYVYCPDGRPSTVPTAGLRYIPASRTHSRKSSSATAATTTGPSSNTSITNCWARGCSTTRPTARARRSPCI